jgi:hypothetical protein
MTASGYELHVYCDYQNPFHGYKEDRDEYRDESKRVAWQQARKAGWQFRMVNGKQMARCPKCVRMKVKTIANGGKGF